MKNCHNCASYQHGAGSKSCLSCPKYKTIQKQSVRRRTIRVEAFPAAIIEQIADIAGPEGEDIVSAIRQLPAELSAVISLRYLSGLTTDEIAVTLRISERTARYRIAEALVAVKKIAAL